MRFVGGNHSPLMGMAATRSPRTSHKSRRVTFSTDLSVYPIPVGFFVPLLFFCFIILSPGYGLFLMVGGDDSAVSCGYVSTHNI